MSAPRPSIPPAFWLLTLVNLLVGGMVGLERTVVPVIGVELFGVAEGSALVAFVVSFGLSKAVFNLLAGGLADRVGRRRVLLLGWILGLPVPVLLIWAPTWSWVIAANLLLGVNQAFTWSMTVNMMVDLVPAERRGFAAGLNEFAGYAGVSALAFLTGLVATAYGLRPEPFYLGVAVSLLGLALALLVPETAPRTGAAPLRRIAGTGVGVPSLLGAATNLKDGLVWLALPLMMTARGFDLTEVGAVAGLYPLVWAVGQIVFGPLSDRLGRWRLILPGMLVQGLGLILLATATGLITMLVAATLLGIGTGMVYPTLIALVADTVPDTQRATALGIYRFFRDGGYALGAIVAGAGITHLDRTVFVTGLLLVATTVVAGVAGRSPSSDSAAGRPR
jgi:MFS family permease